MANSPEITLEQWRALMAVVDAGGYARAAKLLHKSQSSVTYAVQTLESRLGVRAFELKGRKAVLTATGELLYRRARALLEDASELERAAKRACAGWEAKLSVVAEILFPTWLLLECLSRFSAESPHTRVEVFETVLGGTTEAVLARKADLALTPELPPGMFGEQIMRTRFVAAAHPEHPLHKLGRPLTTRDLRKQRHLIVRDSGSQRSVKTSSVNVEQRWTFSNMATSIQAARLGFGFAWYPEEKIREELQAGTLKVLPFGEGGERFRDIYLLLPDAEATGPGARRLAAIIREAAKKL